MSSFIKSVDASVRVIVNVACWPTFNSETSEAILNVGSTVSTAMVTVLEAASFAFPAASVNFDVFTLICAFPVMPSVGVNVAV